MSFKFNEIPVDESIEDTNKQTLSFLRTLSNVKNLPPTLRSQIANNARNLSKDIFGIHKNSATKFHCKKCNVILNNDMITLKIEKRNKRKKLCEMICKGCGSIFYFEFNNKHKSQKCLDNKLETKVDTKVTIFKPPKSQLVTKQKVDVKPKKKLSKLQMMLQQQTESDNTSHLSTFFDSFSL